MLAGKKKAGGQGVCPGFYPGGGGVGTTHLEAGDEVGGLEERELADLVDNGINLGVGSGLGRVPPSRRRSGSGGAEHVG